MPESHAKFWAFFSEMERVRVRRAAGGPPPYTDDPVLEHFYFPNIFPIDDTGNVYYYVRASRVPRLAVWQAHVYRLMNRPQTFDAAQRELGYTFPDPTPEALCQWTDWLLVQRVRGIVVDALQKHLPKAE